jgi:hypothetical protein
LNHTPTKPFKVIDQETSDFLDQCRSRMQELVEQACSGASLLPSWKPGPSADKNLAKHISELCIPILSNGQPSLLLHDLGEEVDSERIQKIFFGDHKCVTRCPMCFPPNKLIIPGYLSILLDLVKLDYFSKACVSDGAFTS